MEMGWAESVWSSAVSVMHEICNLIKLIFCILSFKWRLWSKVFVTYVLMRRGYFWRNVCIWWGRCIFEEIDVFSSVPEDVMVFSSVLEVPGTTLSITEDVLNTVSDSVDAEILSSADDVVLDDNESYSFGFDVWVGTSGSQDEVATALRVGFHSDTVYISWLEYLACLY